MKLYQAKTEPSTIVFHNANVDWVMRITADRRIEVNEDVEVAEAAQKVLDAMQQLLTKGLDKAVADEREACAKVCDSAIEYDGFTEEQNASEKLAAAIRARGVTTVPLYTHPPQEQNCQEEHIRDLVYRLQKRAEIRRQISVRKSVQEGKPDRIADLLDEAADALLKKKNT